MKKCNLASFSNGFFFIYDNVISKSPYTKSGYLAAIIGQLVMQVQLPST